MSFQTHGVCATVAREIHAWWVNIRHVHWETTAVSAKHTSGSDKVAPGPSWTIRQIIWSSDWCDWRFDCAIKWFRELLVKSREHACFSSHIVAIWLQIVALSLWQIFPVGSECVNAHIACRKHLYRQEAIYTHNARHWRYLVALLCLHIVVVNCFCVQTGSIVMVFGGWLVGEHIHRCIVFVRDRVNRNVAHVVNIVFLDGNFNLTDIEWSITKSFRQNEVLTACKVDGIDVALGKEVTFLVIHLNIKHTWVVLCHTFCMNEVGIKHILWEIATNEKRGNNLVACGIKQEVVFVVVVNHFCGAVFSKVYSPICWQVRISGVELAVRLIHFAEIFSHAHHVGAQSVETKQILAATVSVPLCSKRSSLVVVWNYNLRRFWGCKSRTHCSKQQWKQEANFLHVVNEF